MEEGRKEGRKEGKLGETQVSEEKRQKRKKKGSKD